MGWHSPASMAPSIQAPPSPPIRMHSAAMRQDWLAFRHQYVTPEGRVIDTGNGNASHSEGQGWGLMGAQAADDQETFASLLDWTTHALRRRPNDTLHAWRYKPADANPVSDLNNATDGDLFIASALARAAIRWQRPDYAAQAAHLARDILGLVRTAGARTVLLPGASGFEKPDCLSLNPSYYAFGLFPDLAALVPSAKWDLLRQDGAALILQGALRQVDAAAGLAAGGPGRRVAQHRAGLAAALLLGCDPGADAPGLGRHSGGTAVHIVPALLDGARPTRSRPGSTCAPRRRPHTPPRPASAPWPRLATRHRSGQDKRAAICYGCERLLRCRPRPAVAYRGGGGRAFRGVKWRGRDE